MDVVNFILKKSLIIVSLGVKTRDSRTSLQQIDFYVAFANTIKNNPNFLEYFKENIISIISTLQEILLIPKDMDIETDQEYRKEEDLKHFRKEFLHIYQLLFSIKELKEVIMNDLLNKISIIKTDKEKKLSLHQVELYLFILGNIDNNSTNSTEDIKCKNLIVETIFQTSFLDYNSETILLLFLETIVKYINVYISNSKILSSVVNLFISEKGVNYPNLKIASKISNIMLKFIDKTRNNLDGENCVLMIESIKKILYQIISSNNTKILTDFSSVYQSFGILINNSKLSNNPIKTECYVGVFNSFLSFFGLSFNENVSVLPELSKVDSSSFVIVSKLMISFFKSFNAEMKTDKNLFNSFFYTIYFKVYQKINFSGIGNAELNNVASSMINLLQKIFIILNKESLIYLENFLLSDATSCSIEMFENCVKFLINFTSQLKKDSKELLNKCFGKFFITIKNTPLPQNSISENEKTTLSLYSNLLKLLGNICFDFVEVFFETQEMNKLGVIDFLMNTCLNIIENSSKRAAFKCIRGFVTYLVKVDNKEIMSKLHEILNFSILLCNKLDFNDPTEISVSLF